MKIFFFFSPFISEVWVKGFFLFFLIYIKLKRNRPTNSSKSYFCLVGPGDVPGCVQVNPEHRVTVAWARGLVAVPTLELSLGQRLLGLGFCVLLAMAARSAVGGKFYLRVQAMKALPMFTPPPGNCFPCPLGQSQPSWGGTGLLLGGTGCPQGTLTGTSVVPPPLCCKTSRPKT